MEIIDFVQGRIENILTSKEPQKFNWNNSMFEDTQYLSIDKRGRLSEIITANILRNMGCNISYHNNSTDPERGYDLISNNIKIEVKLATITVGSGMFQHENLSPQRNFDAVIFIDIAPNSLYLTSVKKQNIIWSLKAGDRRKNLRKLHRRPNGLYKCDFTIKSIENNKILQFREYKTGKVKTFIDFFEIYQHLE